jgi:hypothetical protein
MQTASLGEKRAILEDAVGVTAENATYAWLDVFQTM